MGHFVKTPPVLSAVFNSYIWHFSRQEKVIYLTFDDGPTPEITPWVLSTLKTFNAKATFFCIGKNISANPKLLKDIIDQNHSIGNHTYNHLNGLKIKTKSYLLNVIKTQDEILKHPSYKQPESYLLFRPPYGKCWPKTLKQLGKLNYKTVLWDVLSRDFDLKISKEACYNNVIKHTENGSIIVFHDSIKAAEKLKYTLPKVLEYYSLKGFKFRAIKDIAQPN